MSYLQETYPKTFADFYFGADSADPPQWVTWDEFFIKKGVDFSDYTGSSLGEKVLFAFSQLESKQ